MMRTKTTPLATYYRGWFAVRHAGAVLLMGILAAVGCATHSSGSFVSNQDNLDSRLPSSARNDNLSVNNIVAVYKIPDNNPNTKCSPVNIATGSDGNMWFTCSDRQRIYNVSPSGVFTDYVIPGFADDIAPGDAGTLWFTVGLSIGKITTTGQVTEYGGTKSNTAGIIKGPDGNIWFTDILDYIGKITPTGGITEYYCQCSFPIDIAAGPDGNLWFIGNKSNTFPYVGIVGKITTNGAVSVYDGPGDKGQGIASGPDGNLYVAASAGIWRVSTSGTVTRLNSPPGSWHDIASGPEHRMWITGSGLVTYDLRTGLFSNVITSPLGYGVDVGSDGDIWVADHISNTIAVYEERITNIGIRLNGELSFTDPNYGFELGYAVGTGTQTQTINLGTGESVQFYNLDTTPHSAAFLGNATVNSAPWPATFTGSTIESPAGTAIGTAGWATGSLNPNRNSPIYETSLPGFYMIGDQYDYVSHMMRTVIVVH